MVFERTQRCPARSSASTHRGAKTASAWLVALATLAAPTSGCRPAAHDRASRPLEILAPTEIATLDPRFSTRALDVKVTRLVHAGLVGLDPSTLAPVPLVAASWHFQDARTLDVALKPGVHFHSGRALAPRDVCATLAALADPRLGSPHRAVVEAIGSCTPDGQRRLTIRLRAPRATLLTDLEVPILRADQARLPPQPNGDLDGLGPYRIARADDDAVTLEPASTGVLPRPAHAVIIRTVRDENARALRLLAGHADVTVNAISPALLPALERQNGLSVVSRPGANVTYLIMQNDRAPFDRRAVRHAVARAIDRARIVRTLLAGRAQVASQIFPPSSWAHASDLQPEPFDRASARPVLAELPPETLLTGTDRAHVVVARAVAQMLSDAGLRVRVVPLDLGVLLERLDAGDFAMAILEMPELTEPNVLKWFFDPNGVPGEGGLGRNRARYRSAEAGALLERASEVQGIQARRPLYVQLAHLMARDMPVVPLWHTDQIAVVSRRARGFVPSAEGRWLSIASVR
jgi:peptide/nickel transport system substrate-binding protein